MASAEDEIVMFGGGRDWKPWHSEDYRAYLQSAAWKARRDACLCRYGGLCVDCGNPATDVDHLTYERFGDELPTDLQAVCRRCHDNREEARREKRQRRDAEREAAWTGQRDRWKQESEAREQEERQRFGGLREWEFKQHMDRWAKQRYGKDWKAIRDHGQVERDFRVWQIRMRVTTREIEHG